MREGYRLSPSDRVLLQAPLSHDVSGQELWLPLMCGATTVLARPGGHRDASYLAGLIRSRGVTIAHFLPTRLREFLEDPEAAACESLRHVVCSGEELPPDLQRRFHEVLPHALLDHLYGPTEAANAVCGWRCDPRAVADPDAPVADGDEGELCVGGPQVGRGYHGRPAFTAERFVPDPFRATAGATAGARMVRTGDLARRRPDGALELLGRFER